MKVVYVAGPFRGPNAWAIEQNVRRAEEWGLRVAEAGATPLIPHANSRFFHGQLTELFWIDATKELLRRCDAIFLIPGWEKSTGARGERDEALLRGMPIFEGVAELRHWLESFR